MIVEIVRKPYGIGYNVFFFERACAVEGRGVFLNQPVGIKDGRIQWERKFYREDSAIESPSWELSEFDLIELANALEKMNIQTDSDSKLQGKVEAMKYHLEDLRKLLKLV